MKGMIIFLLTGLITVMAFGKYIAGILVTGCLLLAIGKFSFRRMVEREKVYLFCSKKTDTEKITFYDLENIPELLKKHIVRTHLIGKNRVLNLTIKQKGKIKVDKNKDWRPFTATQYISSTCPGFIWYAKTFPILIRDKYLANKGEAKVSFGGMKTLAVATGNEIDQGALLRYLGELVWLPSGLLDKRISWTERDAHSLNATLTVDSLMVNGVFYFNDKGLIDRFEAKRYYESNGKYTLENWSAVIDSYVNFNGILIPDKGKVIWNLKEGDFEYFIFEIVDYING